MTKQRGQIILGCSAKLHLKADDEVVDVVVSGGPDEHGQYAVRLRSGRAKGRVIKVSGNRLRGEERIGDKR